MNNLKRKQLAQKISESINSLSLENECDMPDFIIANYLVQCFESLCIAKQTNDKWHGTEVKVNKYLERKLEEPLPNEIVQEFSDFDKLVAFVYEVPTFFHVAPGILKKIKLSFGELEQNSENLQLLIEGYGIPEDHQERVLTIFNCWVEWHTVYQDHDFDEYIEAKFLDLNVEPYKNESYVSQINKRNLLVRSVAVAVNQREMLLFANLIQKDYTNPAEIHEEIEMRKNWLETPSTFTCDIRKVVELRIKYKQWLSDCNKYEVFEKLGGFQNIKFDGELIQRQTMLNVIFLMMDNYLVAGRTPQECFDNALKKYKTEFTCSNIADMCQAYVILHQKSKNANNL